MMELTTNELLQLVSIDSRRAFDMFYNIYYKQVFRFVYYQLKDTGACREVVSNVFFSVWRSRTSLTKIKSIDAYLYTTARNEVQRYMAKNNDYRNISIDEIPIQVEVREDDTPEKKLINKEIETFVSQIISQLPEKCRVIFLMNRHEGLKNAEIAERLSISESTVRVQMKIAIEKITAQVKQHFPNLSFIVLFCMLFG
jgi:RNA polymerase sigma-70 factor (ECF subfamily)